MTNEKKNWEEMYLFIRNIFVLQGLCPGDRLVSNYKKVSKKYLEDLNKRYFDDDCLFAEEVDIEEKKFLNRDISLMRYIKAARRERRRLIKKKDVQRTCPFI
jgi:hypothetical protein